MRVLLTGASGFVGRHLAADLLARGHAVRAAMRDSAALPPGAELAPIGDLGEPVDWGPLLQGVDAVVHGAGIAHAGPGLPDDLYARVNRDATLALAQAAAERVSRFVFLSSIRAQSGPTSTHALTEDDAPEPTDAYGRSKLEAERGLAALPGLNATALRPVVVYGPGVRGNMGALAKLARLPVPLPFGALQTPRSVVSVENLASAVAFALEAAEPTRGAFIVADPEPIALGALVAAMRAALGRPAMLLPIPPALMGGALRALRKGEAWERLSGAMTASPSRLISLGWTPPVRSTPEGIRRWLAPGSRPA